MTGIIHTYYTVALAPAVAALVGMGAVDLWRMRERAVHALGAAGRPSRRAACGPTRCWSGTPDFAPGPVAGWCCIALAAAAAVRCSSTAPACPGAPAWPPPPWPRRAGRPDRRVRPGHRRIDPRRRQPERRPTVVTARVAARAGWAAWARPGGGAPAGGGASPGRRASGRRARAAAAAGPSGRSVRGGGDAEARAPTRPGGLLRQPRLGPLDRGDERRRQRRAPPAGRRRPGDGRWAASTAATRRPTLAEVHRARERAETCRYYVGGGMGGGGLGGRDGDSAAIQRRGSEEHGTRVDAESVGRRDRLRPRLGPAGGAVRADAARRARPRSSGSPRAVGSGGGTAGSPPSIRAASRTPGELAHGPVGHEDAGQADDVVALEVVDADDGDVAGDGEPHPARGVDRPAREQVAEREDRARARRGPQSATRAAVSPSATVGPARRSG